jgi:general secretion pathway protein A
MQVTRKILRRAAGEVFGMSAPRLFWRRVGWRLKLTVAVCGGVAVGAGYVLVAKPLSAAPTADSAAAAMARATPLTAPFSTEPSVALAASKLPVSGAGAEPSLLEDLSWPDAAGPRSRSEELAFQQLFRLYGVAYERNGMGPACKAAQGVHLHCLSGRGGLSDLIRINQPAVLLMDGEGKGRQYYAVITALAGKTANFSVGGAERRVSLAAIAPLWSGNYVTLWNAPPGGQTTLAPNSRGPAVMWLRQGLARLQGGEADGPPVYDGELARRVKAFQLAEGMAPDGVAGALTLIRLNMRLDQSLPRLTATVGG